MGWGWVDDVIDAIGDFGSEAIDTVVGYGGDIVDWVSEGFDYFDPAETDWDSDIWDMDDNIGEISDGYYAVEEPVSTFDFTNDWADIEDAFEGEAMTDASGYDNDANWVGHGPEPGVGFDFSGDAGGALEDELEGEAMTDASGYDNDANWVGEGPEPDAGSDLFDKAKKLATDKAKKLAEAQAKKLLGGAPVSPIPAGLPTAGVDPNLLAALVAGQTQLPAPTPAAVAEIPFGPVDPYSGNILEPDRRDLRAPVRSAAQGGIIENKTAEILRILGNKYG
tara:strand:- start:288 stop:1124 length:837 start_codon:yes stop_codon:yes gene_type:complete